MKISNLFYIIVTWCISMQLSAQIDRIEQIENNLFETRTIVFTDTLYPRYTITERMKFYQIPSVSIALINNGEIEWSKAYGLADIENNRQANVATLYQVASISKSINGWAFMKLVQENKLSSTKDIREYLKTWTFPDNDFSRNKTITIKNLLSHTAGLSTRGYIGYAQQEQIPTINQILNGENPANNEAVVPIFEPNTIYQYSGGGYTIFRKIIDDNLTKNYDRFMQALVLKPLKMSNSTFNMPLKRTAKNFAKGYDADARPLISDYYLYPDKAAGGLWSTATDIAKFVIEVQNAYNGKKALLSKQLATEMLTPVLEGYAIGFGVKEIGGEKYFYHEGESFGYRSVYYGSPTSGKGVVILTNAYPENAKPFMDELLNRVATTYEWSGFYNPLKKKLAFVSDSILQKYIGDYHSESPSMKISITQNGNYIELTARRPERMYPISDNGFFLASSPNDSCVFSSSKDDGFFDTFEVIQDGKTIIKATRTRD